MRHRLRFRFSLELLAAGTISLAAGALLAQSPAASDSASSPGGAQVGFHYENQQLQPAKYSFAVFENGAGQFHSEPAEAPVADTASYRPMARALDRPIQLSKPVTEQIFSIARAAKLFNVNCEAKDRVAYQGTKQLSYRGPEGSGSCIYNWSKLAAIQKVTSIFESIAFTLEEGRRLEVEHKHDRLALDAELGSLLDAVKGGQALEIQNIQPVLREIIDDEAVLDRARARAKKLLGEQNATASLR